MLVATALSSLSGSEREAARRASQEAARAFDLASEPPVRFHFYQTSGHGGLLLMAMHHICSDGLSMAILMRELEALLRQELGTLSSSGHHEALPTLHIGYSDFAEWQRKWLENETDEYQRQVAFWREKLCVQRGGDRGKWMMDVGPLQLPLDRSRPAEGLSFRGGSASIRVDGETADGLRSLALQQGTTLFGVVIAAWAVLLWRYTGSQQDDIVMGTPVSGRTQSSDIEPLVGMFVNEVVIRARLSDGNKSFEALVRDVRYDAL